MTSLNDSHLVSFIEPTSTWCLLTALLMRSMEVSGRGATPAQTILIADHTRGALRSGWISQFRLSTAHPYGGYPTLNKISLLDHVSHHSFQVLLDHDIIALTPWRLVEFQAEAVFAATNRKDLVDKRFGPDLRSFCHEVTGKHWSDVAYYNAGVVIIPRRYCALLRTAWSKIAIELMNRFRVHESLSPLPVGNLTFSLALALADLPNRRLPDEANQRNWGHLPKDPVLLHYNNFDAENQQLKDNGALTLAMLRQFVEHTSNRWWSAYRHRILPLLDQRMDVLASELWEFARG